MFTCEQTTREVECAWHVHACKMYVLKCVFIIPGGNSQYLQYKDINGHDMINVYSIAQLWNNLQMIKRTFSYFFYISLIQKTQIGKST